uniref:Ionotropic glutamate receptor C-terminal domain-containing protein n=1 Tax=Anopheles arabiensis TaxID=7173 RepID=A0A182HYZ4_ANOAR
METVQNFASMLYKCMMYYFYYDPVTLAGSWTIERGGKRIYTLADFGTGDTAGWNLRGQTVAFLNMDPNRATAHDIEIGQTMAKRHNGTFAMAQGLLQCFDYVYTAIYATSVGSFATLPEMFQMCFLVPKSAPKSVFAILSDPFDYYCWGTFIFTIATVSVLLSLFGESYRQYNVGLVFLELVMNALNGPSHRFYGRFEVRLVGLFMMMNIVLLSCYQSLIISLMSSARYDPEIDTIEQINDTCQFQRDLFLQSLGYRFKNTIYTYRRYESYEEIWANKICLMVMCSDLSTGHALVATQSNNFDDDMDNNLERYFRISKARIRSSAVMYSIMNFSPMRTLIHRYTSAYSEGHLHHLPLVKAKKHSSSQPNAHESIVLVTMRPEDLLIVLRDHIEKSATFIAVLPNDVLESMQKYAARRHLCMMYYYHYDPATFAGTWTILHDGKVQHELAEVGDDWDLRGERLVFLNADSDRETTFDTDLGRTIAERHNGSFREADDIMECCEYMYSPNYGGGLGIYTTLPEMVQLCFIVPRSVPRSIFSILLEPFDSYSWGAFGLTVVIFSVLLSLFGESYRQYNVVLICLELVMNALNGPTHQFEGRFEVRMIGLFMLMNVVLISCYQSIVISLLSTVRYDDELDTMEQVNDTCYFEHNLFREFLGQRFKNIFRGFALYGTYEHMWTHKVCQIISCNDLVMGNMRIQTLAAGFNDQDDPEFDRYYRYSKAHLRAMVGMYGVYNFSPMRNIIKRYVAAYTEGHLHHLPLLKSGTLVADGLDAQANIRLVALTAQDLSLVWIMLLVGCA